MLPLEHAWSAFVEEATKARLADWKARSALRTLRLREPEHEVAELLDQGLATPIHKLVALLGAKATSSEACHALYPTVRDEWLAYWTSIRAQPGYRCDGVAG